MEWVETTAKTIDEARNAALDQLGVAADDAEFEIVEEPKQGLFGRVRGQARVRARVRPTPVRPKQDRRRRGRDGKSRRGARASEESSVATVASEEAKAANDDTDGNGAEPSDGTPDAAAGGSPDAGARTAANRRRGGKGRPNGATRQEDAGMDDAQNRDDGADGAAQATNGVTPQEVGDAAVDFVDGLAGAFGLDSTAELAIDGSDLEVAVSGDGLGLLVGPGGRTLNAIQDLARVASQRRLGDHDTRLRVDVSGYRQRREAALAKFARDVAEQVRSSGTPRSLEPMVSADRKIVHDILNEEAGVSSRSEGDEPTRRIIVELA